MVPQNILARVFHLRIGDEMFSGFTIETERRQYLITAAHSIPDQLTPSEVQLFRNGRWEPVRFRRVPLESSKVDIAVLAIDHQLSPIVMDIELGYDNSTYLSQEVFFLGFPFGARIEAAPLNAGFPIPLVKRGIVSSLPIARTDEPFLVDASNNPGFSGGPVVAIEGAMPNVRTRVIGVVSGYLQSAQPVFTGPPVAPPLTPTKTEYWAFVNTGLLRAYSIDYALAAIAKHPIGAPLTPTPTPTR